MALRVAIVGAGAVGLGIASALVAPEARGSVERIRIVTRRESVARALAEGGIARRGIFGDCDAPGDAFDVEAGLASLAGERFDWIIVATKTPAAEGVARELAEHWPRIEGAKRVLLTFNGWGTADHFAAQLPHDVLYSARVITGFRREAPGSVDIAVTAGPILVGSLYGADVEAAAPVCAALAAGGIPCETSDDIASELWAKMLYNCALNPLGALIGVPYGVLGEREETRSIMAAVVAEIFAFMAATGHRTHWDDAASYLEHFYGTLLPPTAAHESSMLQDLRAGRRSEIDALSGAIVDLAQQHGLATPVNAALAKLVRAREERSTKAH